MYKSAVHNAGVDRLEVFISSTIVECQSERAAIRKAIHSLNFVPVQFEREGARAEAPRDFYLRKLQASHIVIGVYRNSYGWVDTGKGMAISGLEDEYRETIRLEKDLLSYVLKSAPDRDPRLSTMLEELKSGPHVIYFYDDGEDLESRVRDDITALVSDRVSRFQNRRLMLSSAAEVLSSIFRKSPFRIRRTALLDELTKAATFSRIVWLTGCAGAGKTVLAAEWAEERSAAYVNARALDPRSILLSAARVLEIANDAELAVPVFDDARALLLSRWHLGRNWPLVVDAPEDIDSIWAVLSECLGNSGVGSILVTARELPQDLPGQCVQVKGFTAEELAALNTIAGGRTLDVVEGELPFILRRSNANESLVSRFEVADALSREILGYIALSPTVLGLEDLVELLGNSATSAIELTDRIDSLADMVIDSAGGFEFVHDNYRDSLASFLNSRPQLKSLLITRLATRLSTTGRSWAAFSLCRDGNPEQAEKLANQSVQEAVFTGATRHLIDALEFLKTFYNKRAEKGRLVAVLMSLADTQSGQGKTADAFASLNEALQLANEIEDTDAQRALEILHASLALRQSASREALQRITLLRKSAQEDGRRDDEARLLLEEGTALLGANETEAAVPIYRAAREIFVSIGDNYGVQIATRNLIGSLGLSQEGIAESDRLRAEIDESETNTPRYRAWLYNLLVPRLRREKRYDEAEAMARDAIAIGHSLGDRYIVAINLLVLGNVFRDAGRTSEALEAYSESGQIALEIGRKDIEGRSFRLRALVENEIAQASVKNQKIHHAELAVLHATRAAEIFSHSFAWSEYGFALEERGDARRLLNENSRANIDYADAISAFSRAKNEQDVERLLRFLVAVMEDEIHAPLLIARSFGLPADDSIERSEIWIRSFVAVIEQCPVKLMPTILGILIRSFYPGGEGGWWFECLMRCLLISNQRRNLKKRVEVGSLLLLSILGHSKYRGFSVDQLTVLAGICCAHSDRLTVKYKRGSDLNLILRIGNSGQILIIISDEAKAPEAVFVSLFIGAFLDAFAVDIAKIFFENGRGAGIALDLISFPQSSESATVAEFMSEGLRNAPVAFARIAPENEEKLPVIALVRKDAMQMLIAKLDKGGELEIMLARFLDQMLYFTSGGTLDDDIYRSKVLELLMQVLH